MNSDSPEFNFYGHHKCASSSINRLLWRATAALGKSFASFNSDEEAGGCIKTAASRAKLDALSIRNAIWSHAELFPDVPAVHCIRDPRDVLVSGYFSHLKTHRIFDDEMAEERKMLNELSQDEGLIAAMDGITGRTLTEMGEWQYGQSERILEFKLEELTQDWVRGLQQIVKHAGWLAEDSGEGDTLFGLGVLKFNTASHRVIGRRLLKRRALRYQEFLRLAEGVSFKKLSGGRKPGQTDSSSHYRSGKHGDWRSYFTDEVEGAFKERFPGLAVKLGYEVSDAWTANSELT